MTLFDWANTLYTDGLTAVAAFLNAALSVGLFAIIIPIILVDLLVMIYVSFTKNRGGGTR